MKNISRAKWKIPNFCYVGSWMVWLDDETIRPFAKQSDVDDYLFRMARLKYRS